MSKPAINSSITHILAKLRLATAIRAAIVVVSLFSMQVLWSIWSDYRNVIDNEYDSLSVRVRLVEAKISGSLRSMDLLLRALSERRMKHGQVSVASFRRDLQNSMPLIPEISGIFITNAQGIVTVHTNPDDEGFDASQREHFKFHAQAGAGNNEYFISKPYIPGRESYKRHIFTLTRALRGPAGEFMGIIAARIELGTFAEIFRPLVPPASGSLALVYSDGDILFRWPNPEHFAGGSLSKGIAFKAHMSSGETETRHRNISAADGVERILVYHRVGNDKRLEVAVSSEAEQVFANWRHNSWQRLVLLATIIATLVLAFLLMQRRQKELERAQKFAEKIITTSPIGICIYDQTGQCLSANEAVVKHLGDTMENVLAQNYHDNEEWKRSGIYQLALNTQQTGMASAQVVHIRTRSGKEIWLSVTFSALEKDGWLIFTSYDLSDVKLAQQLRRESEERLQMLFSNTLDGIMQSEPDGRILNANPAACSMLGRSEAELCQLTSWRRVFEGSDLRLLDFIEERSLNGRAYAEVTMLRGNGERFEAGISSVIYTTPENKTLSSFFFRDITERKRQEKEAADLREQLAQASKMESIGHLTAGVAHDFNNILGAIVGYSELSRHMLVAGKTDAVTRYQDEILKAGNRAKQLIAQMLTFSRQSKTDKEAPVTMLSPIVREVVSLLRSSIPSTIALTYRIENEELKARIEPVQLHQIILNLAVNARDAIGDFGKIEIILSKQYVDNAVCSSCNIVFAGEYANITVKDSGSGIPLKILKKIFDPFFTTKAVGKGTGMGLSVVHGLVHALGGHIRVETSATSGSAINILLPLESSAATPLEAGSTPAASTIVGARIMVVDDEKALARMLQEVLAAQGAHVMAFTDPAHALQTFMQQPDQVDLVITDETMPGLSGMLLAEKLLMLKPGLPIILCTGYSERATAESTAKIGIGGFLTKPVNLHELLQKIQSLLKARAQ